VDNEQHENSPACHALNKTSATALPTHFVREKRTQEWRGSALNLFQYKHEQGEGRTQIGLTYMIQFKLYVPVVHVRGASDVHATRYHGDNDLRHLSTPSATRRTTEIVMMNYLL
jgi:hypothetical protein